MVRLRLGGAYVGLSAPLERWIVLICGCGKLRGVLGASTVNMWRASDNGKLSPI
jgi:hypothetical protein